jgi:hypothetical protein
MTAAYRSATLRLPDQRKLHTVCSTRTPYVLVTHRPDFSPRVMGRYATLRSAQSARNRTLLHYYEPQWLSIFDTTSKRKVG